MAGSSATLELPVDLPELPEGWDYAPLGRLVDESRGISYGIVQPGSHADGGVPIVRVNNIRRGRIATEDALRVQPEIEARYERSRLRGGEVLLTLVGSLGESAIVPDELTGWNVARAVGIIPVLAGVGPRWVELCLRSALIQHYIRTWATTTVQATFNLRDLARLPIPMPPETERRAIALILGTLDDKIELNRRMNQTLEAMARAIFQSWFVDFDPVRSKAEGKQPHGLKPKLAALFPAAFEDSPLGALPKGWQVFSLPELFEVNPSRQLSRGAVAPYLDMANMPTEGHAPVSWIEREVGSGMKFVNCDTLVARITPYLENGKTAFVDFLKEDQVGWGSTEYIVLRPREPIPTVMAYLIARSNDFRTFAVRRMTGSSGRQRVPAESLNQYMLAAPEKDSPLYIAFGSVANPLFDRARSAMEQNRVLAALRDTLLPKLISCWSGSSTSSK